MIDPGFSILLSVYNRDDPKFLKAALQSVLNQTLVPNEVIIVKDGPLTNELEEVIQYFLLDNFQKYKIIPLSENIGLGAALGIGLEACTYPIVARMDSDDISLPDRFEKQYAFMADNPMIDVVGTNVEEFNQIPGDLKQYRVLPETGQELRSYAKFRSPLNHPSIMFKKESVLSVGNYNGDIRLFEDFSLFARMLNSGCIFYNIQESLLYFRVGNGLASIKRRSGIQYVKSELKFLYYVKKIGYLNLWEVFLYFVLKIPLRFLPPRFMLWLYRYFLRKRL